MSSPGALAWKRRFVQPQSTQEPQKPGRLVKINDPEAECMYEENLVDCRVCFIKSSHLPLKFNQPIKLLESYRLSSLHNVCMVALCWRKLAESFGCEHRTSQSL